MRVNLIVNLYRQDAIRAAKATADWLTTRGIEVGSDREGSTALGVQAHSPDQLASADLMMTFGGDGTLMRAAHLCAQSGTPILGVFYGRFGFVTQVKPEETGAALSQFIDGQSTIVDRMMVQTDLIREDRTVATLHSLNEAAVQRSATTRMLTFDTRVNGRPLSRYPADGIMVSTPTGSTAYALSAGGTLLHPSIAGWIIVPIAPHTLSNRPFVLADSSEVTIELVAGRDASASFDNQSLASLMHGDRITVKRSAHESRFLHPRGWNFFDTLRKKLHWNEGGA